MNLKEKLANLPTNPGCYIYYDSDGNVLYVGKAKNLRNRVKQYFSNSNDKTDKVIALVSHIHDMRYIIANSESDALSLENTLIKKHTPPYNILLKDDKQYPYVKIDLSERYPRVQFVRKLLRDKAKYFGPITSGGAKNLQALLAKLFPTATCHYDLTNLPKGFRPCLNAHIGTCCAPCTSKTSEKQYRELIDQVVSFLSGNTSQIRSQLEDKMLSFSEEMQYEQALECKHSIDLIDKIGGSQVTVLNKLVDYDFFALASNGKQSVVNHTMIRGGKVTFSDNYVTSDAGIDESQTLSSFLLEHCLSANISKQLFVSCQLPDGEVVAQLLSEELGKTVTISCPMRGEKKQLIAMSLANAETYLDKQQTAIERKYNATVGAVSQLKQLLNLKTLPKRIECYDISNISGVDKVASMVVFTNGSKDGGSYRRFMIKTVEGANDFASMNEVLSRRMARLDDEKFGARPDLIVVDGGLGQLEYARRAVEPYGIALVSLAKREELVYNLYSNVPTVLPRNSYSLNLLINIRDESHRFAITYFRQLHGKNALKSILSEIDGVGEKRLQTLQRHYKSIENIKQASVDDLCSLNGITTQVAEKIFAFFHPIEGISE